MIQAEMRHHDVPHFPRGIAQPKDLVQRRLIRRAKGPRQASEGPHAPGWIAVIPGAQAGIDQDQTVIRLGQQAASGPIDGRERETDGGAIQNLYLHGRFAPSG